MNKLIITISLLFFSLLLSTYLVSERTQSQIQELIAKQEGKAIQLELVGYSKSLFSSKMQLKISIDTEQQRPLILLMSSNIEHFPYQSVLTNNISFVDPDVSLAFQRFFEDDKWSTSRIKLTLWGSSHGEMLLPAGQFSSEFEQFNSADLLLSYQYNLNDGGGEFTVNWGGFSKRADGIEMQLENLFFIADFATSSQTELFNYDYQTHISQIELNYHGEPVLFEGIELQGRYRVSQDKQTVSSDNQFNVAHYQVGQERYTHNQLSLSLTNLNLAALTMIKNARDSQVISKALSQLLNDGADIHLHSLQSQTPWGALSADLLMQLEPGSILAEVLDNPLALIDYVNGELSLILPKKLSEQANFASIIDMAISNGLLIPNEQRLTLKSTLQRGELVVNGQVIPM